MASDFHHRALKEQAAALRTAALQAGPDTLVSTCPGWDVRKLVQHVARVYAMVALALRTEPNAAAPSAPRPPADFDDALIWFDGRLSEALTELSTVDPERPVWAFFPGGDAPRWTRRMAHETAIHRLDAEHALAGLGPDHVHDLIFDPELAADGVDEFLTVILPLGDWSQRDDSGSVLYHAADAGRAWLVEYRPGRAPRVDERVDTGLEADATVAGTADAVYRRVWGRPSTALVTGDTALAALASGR